MGLSASQARLITLGSRLRGIEHEQQKLANTKLRFSIESSEVATRYENELNKYKYQFKNSAGQYADMTLKTLIENGKYHLIRVRDNKKVVTNSCQNPISTDGTLKFAKKAELSFAFKAPAVTRYRLSGPNYNPPELPFKIGSSNDNPGKIQTASLKKIEVVEGFQPIALNLPKIEQGSKKDTEGMCYTPILDTLTGRYILPETQFEGLDKMPMGYQTVSMSQYNTYLGQARAYENYLSQIGNGNGGSQGTGSSSVEYESVIFDDKFLNDPNWLYEAIQSGEFMLVDASGKEINPSSSTEFDEVNDRAGEARAKARYDADMNKINRKEKLIDMQMKQLDTEYQATNKDYESVQNIVSNHAKNDFSLFG